MENTFEKFNKQFFGKCQPTRAIGSNPKSQIELKWFDRSVVFVIGNKTVSIDVSDRGHSDHYMGYVVSVVTTTTGVEATNKLFRFSEHISLWTRRDKNQEYNHAWYNGGKLEWYIDRPVETKSMVEKMFNYVYLFI